jgi:hypothetical protein
MTTEQKKTQQAARTVVFNLVLALTLTSAIHSESPLWSMVMLLIAIPTATLILRDALLSAAGIVPDQIGEDPTEHPTEQPPNHPTEQPPRSGGVSNTTDGVQ